MDNRTRCFRWATLLMLFSMMFIACDSEEDEKHAAPAISVDKSNLHATVRELVNIEPSRSYANLESLNRAADYILKQFKHFGYEPVEQVFHSKGVAYKNIIVGFGPVAAPKLIVGAHYDAYGTQPGADDNASGVAGLLELARLFQVHRPALKHRIEFVAFTLEEPPFFATKKMGSYVHAKRLLEADVQIIGMVSLEMIGYFTEAKNTQKYPLAAMKAIYPSTGNFIAVVGNVDSADLVRHFKRNMKTADIDVESLTAPAGVAGVDFSDHRNYWKFNKKAIMVTDTAFYRNPHYHKRTDTIDTLNFDKMAAVVEGVYRAVKNIDPDVGG